MKKILLLSFVCLVASTNSFAQIIQSQSIYIQEKEKTYPCYQGEFNLGYITPLSAFIETVHGVRINKYLFTGLGLGFRASSEYATYSCKGIEYIPDFGLHFPVFANVKGYYPVSNKIEPYLNLSLGYAVGVGDYSYNEFYCDFGAGIRLWKFTIAMGLMHHSFPETYLNIRGKRIEIVDPTTIDETPINEYNDTWTWKNTGFYLKFGFQW